MHLLAAPGVVHTTNHIDKTVHLNNGHPVVVTNIIPADLAEPISALDAADAVRLTFATAIETTTAADVPAATITVIAATVEAADAADIADAIGILSANAIEAIHAFEDIDASSILFAAAIEIADALDDIDAAVGANFVSATVLEAANAADILDGTVIAAEVEVPITGGGYYPLLRPFPVEGVGFGILPELEGEAHGVIILAGAGVGVLSSPVGEAAGAAGVAGRSAARLVVRAAAIGIRGQAGTAVAVLKGLSIASAGVIGTRGSGSGTIVKLEGAARGRHDDDEAAVLFLTLAA